MTPRHLTVLGDRIDFGALRNIAVFRALQLGDLLCAVPALRALRLAAPHAKITLIGLPWASSFSARFDHYIDDYLMFPGFPGLSETSPQLGVLPDFFSAAHERQFDLALQLHSSGTLTNPITVALGAAKNAGYYLPGRYCPDPENFMLWSEGENEVIRHLRLMNFLGCKADDASLEFPLSDADHQALHDTGQILPAVGEYVCIHPGEHWQSRRWPAKWFALAANGLSRQGLRVVLTGSAKERPIIDAVLADMSAIGCAEPIDMSGRTDLGALAALVAGAKMVLCNDTCISHIAAAVATPSVVICCGTNPLRTAPLNRLRHRMLYASVPCRPCSYAACPIAGHPCAENVSVEQVLNEAMRLCAPNPPRSSVDTAHPAFDVPTMTRKSLSPDRSIRRLDQ